ncbi:hypothetical protein [Pseudonocardia humida]|uniref:Uncharacterized protein n=1 Tax=Pseudonocardia humida TaxID=2800819 RepID=A0ABT1ABQ1_9PSEU|nr:hypothetical protein [Pseudonocardia humida]MCO1660363.1 hypothetical protein [Pseudonocardia humida]
MSTRTDRPSPFHLGHDGARLDLEVRREGLRTGVTLLRDGEQVGRATRLGAVLLPLDAEAGEDGPTVLALTLLPGVVSRAMLLVPRPPAGPGAAPDDAPARPIDDLVGGLPAPLARFATAGKHEFAPPAGSAAARLAVFRREHPRLWASRHVVLATAKVALALLGVAAFLRLLVQPVISWVLSVLPGFDLPAIPWPDIDLPDIPWPDVDLPDLHLPGWLLVLVGTAKFWVPILVAVGLAVVEVRRRRRAAPREDEEDRGAHG